MLRRGTGRHGLVPRLDGPGRRAGASPPSPIGSPWAGSRSCSPAGSRPDEPGVGERLIADLLDPSGDVRDYFASLTRLHQAGSPDLWLPAVPTHGQNANLYDRQWTLDIEDNLRVLQSIASSTPAR